MKIAAWVGTALQIIGVLMLSSNEFYMPLVFAIMLIGSVIWLWLTVKRREWPLVALNGVYTITNIIGIIRWS